MSGGSGVPAQTRTQFPVFLFRDVLGSLLSPCGLIPIPQSLGYQGASATFCNSRPGGLGDLLAGPPSDAAVRRDGGGRPWRSDQVPFRAFWAQGSEAEDSRLLQAGRKARVGLAAQPGSLRLPRPQRKSERPLFLLFFSGVCVVPRRGGPRGLSAPQHSQKNPETVARRPAAGQGQASVEGWRQAAGSSAAGPRAGE